MPKALFAASNAWDSSFRVGSHHLAVGLLRRGWDVAYVSNPISPFHVLAGYSGQLRDRYLNYRAGGVIRENGHLWAYVPATAIPPLNRARIENRWVQRHWQHFTWPSIVKKIKERGFGKVDLLYIDSVVQGFWLQDLSAGAAVLRIADRSSGFSTFGEVSAASEAALAQSVDAVVYSGQVLESYVRALCPKRMSYLPNGVDYQHFQHPSTQPPPEFVDLPRPILVYVGTISDWFDFDAVRAIARSFESASLVLIGPDGLAKNRLDGIPNLHILGARPYEALPGYLHHADVGLIPFDAIRHSDLVNSVHPLKLYEYLASGLPVVATAWQELRELDAPVILVEHPEDYPRAIRRAIEGPVDKARLRAFARQNDWSQRTQMLLDIAGLSDAEGTGAGSVEPG